MNRKDALAKVAKLMRMSKSANANEAATALRMAQKLMEEHAIDTAELDEDGKEQITEECRTGRGKNGPVYAVMLANLICKAFAVRTIWGEGLSTHRLIFVGPYSRVTIALYCYEVLLRQLERDRRKHLARVRKARNRAARGDTFGAYWVRSASEKIQNFAGLDDSGRLDAYIKSRYSDLASSKTEARKSKAVSHGDAYAGHIAGKAAQLNHAMHGSAPVRLEHLL
jgi:hypothetical protein